MTHSVGASVNFHTNGFHIFQVSVQLDQRQSCGPHGFEHCRICFVTPPAKSGSSAAKALQDLPPKAAFRVTFRCRVCEPAPTDSDWVYKRAITPALHTARLLLRSKVRSRSKQSNSRAHSPRGTPRSKTTKLQVFLSFVDPRPARCRSLFLGRCLCTLDRLLASASRWHGFVAPASSKTLVSAPACKAVGLQSTLRSGLCRLRKTPCTVAKRPSPTKHSRHRSCCTSGPPELGFSHTELHTHNATVTLCASRPPDLDRREHRHRLHAW